MAKASIQATTANTAAIRARLEDGDFLKHKTFAPHARAFIATQAKWAKAAGDAEDALGRRDDALAAIGAADDALDASLDAYANDLSAANLGPRANPFAPFSKYSLSELKGLAYAKEPKEVRAVVKAVGKKKPSAAVAKSGARCLANCAAVEKALAAYGKPASAAQKALAARDALLPEVQKAVKALKTHAASAFVDDPATLAALFAPADAVQAPKARRARKAATPEPSPSPSPA